MKCIQSESMSMSVAVISASNGPTAEEVFSAFFSPPSFFGTFSKSPAKEANFEPMFFGADPLWSGFVP